MFTVTPPTKRPASPTTRQRDAKLPRSSFSPTISDASLRAQIDRLSRDEMRSVLVQVTQFHPAATTSIQSILASMKTEAGVKTFDDQVSTCEYHINTKYRRLRPLQQFEVAHDIIQVIEEATQTIANTAQEHGQDGDDETWGNGFRALITIGTGIMSCEHGEIAKILRSQGAIHAVAEGLAQLVSDVPNLDIPDSELAAISRDLTKLGKLVNNYAIDDIAKVAEKMDAAIRELLDSAQSESGEEDQESE